MNERGFSTRGNVYLSECIVRVRHVAATAAAPAAAAATAAAAAAAAATAAAATATAAAAANVLVGLVLAVSSATDRPPGDHWHG